MPKPVTRTLVTGALTALVLIAAVALLTPTHALNLLATHYQSSFLLSQQTSFSRTADARRTLNSSAEDIFGNRGEADRDPDNNLAVEQATNRAYPLTTIPISYTQAAATTFAKLKARSNSGKQTSLQWYLLGPNYAVQPGVLSFNGTQYIASGRVTAMAIAPSCSSNQSNLSVVTMSPAL